MLRLAVVAAALLASLHGSSPTAAAQQASPAATPGPSPVVVPGEEPPGLVYADLAVALALWFDTHGEAPATDCALGQDGPAWFLPGIPASAADLVGVEIVCDVPAGAPIFGSILGAGETGADVCVGPDSEFLASVGGFDAVTLTFDGQEIPDLDRFLVPPTPLRRDGTPVHPGSKFILTVRNKDGWLRSCEAHGRPRRSRRPADAHER
jgi:hypothetical protein